MKVLAVVSIKYLNKHISPFCVLIKLHVNYFAMGSTSEPVQSKEMTLCSKFNLQEENMRTINGNEI